MTISRQSKSRPPDRSAQKRRTRRAILDAAAEFAAEGVAPTVVQAAERADVSRATAYRYFPTQQSLLLELAVPHEDLRAAIQQSAALDPAERIGAIVRAAAHYTWDNQGVLREMLRISLDSAAGDPAYERPSHRRDWIAEALEPLRNDLPEADYRSLSAVLCLFLGAEPMVVMHDIARLPRDEAIDALATAASALVRSWQNKES